MAGSCRKSMIVGVKKNSANQLWLSRCALREVASHLKLGIAKDHETSGANRNQFDASSAVSPAAGQSGSEKNMNRNDRLMRMNYSRRAFLKKGVAGALAASADPLFPGPRAWSSNAPSHKITMGCIGLGSHGHGVNLMSFLQQDDCRVLAVCDVIADRGERSRAVVDQTYGGKSCAAIADFRKLIARDDLDAVVITPPDHWHVPSALRARGAGKKVCCEKPTLTIADRTRTATGGHRETPRGPLCGVARRSFGDSLPQDRRGRARRCDRQSPRGHCAAGDLFQILFPHDGTREGIQAQDVPGGAGNE